MQGVLISCIGRGQNSCGQLTTILKNQINSPNLKIMEKHNRRKFFLYSMGILGGSAITAWIFRQQLVKKFLFTFPENHSVNISKSPTENEVCVLTAKQVEGPFYFPSPERSNIVEDKIGKPFQLKMQIVGHPDCMPIKNAVVEVWQADAEGNYSGYPEEISRDEWKLFMFFGKHAEKKENGEYTVKPTTASKYLRGLQRTDEMVG
jgi:protocatechuate 3,4-dioxygenase beta subunit